MSTQLLASKVSVGMTVRLKIGRVFEVAQIVRETHPHPIVGEVLTFISTNGFRASFKPFGSVEVITAK